jgi:hypothetical protein
MADELGQILVATTVATLYLQVEVERAVALLCNERLRLMHAAEATSVCGASMRRRSGCHDHPRDQERFATADTVSLVSHWWGDAWGT